MIKVTRPRMLTANIRQASRTMLDWPRKFSLGGNLLLRIILVLCFITSTCCDWKERMPRGTSELRKALRRGSLPIGDCDLEKPCNWSWNETIGFRKVTPPIAGGPTTDASNSPTGHFLWFTGPGRAQLSSHTIPPTALSCRLELAMYQIGMRFGDIHLLINKNSTSSMTKFPLSENNEHKWFTTYLKLSTIRQSHQLIIETDIPQNCSTGIDNIRLVDCFPEIRGPCLDRSRICDLTKDCADGEDEKRDCDKIPTNARCNFEDGWCGWTNTTTSPLNWTLHRGATPSEKTGPAYDHTYRNKSGTYAYVNMSQRTSNHSTGFKLGSTAELVSPLYNPTPPYSSDPGSPYYQSCQIRFSYHQFGGSGGALGLNLVQIKAHHNHSERLWWSTGNKGNMWNNQVVPLPNITYRYFFEFEASRGYSSNGDIAIDDISLSPECFGIGVPPEVLKDFDYYNPVIESEKILVQHADFANESVIKISTCGNTGTRGPTSEQCTKEYNRTDIEVLAPPTELEDSTSFNLNGVQRWTAPSGGYYTLIALGARGGKGSSGMGITLGALARGIIELEKGEQLYFMVGQQGTDACVKNIDSTKTNNCRPELDETSTETAQTLDSKMRELLQMQLHDGGGGGGGATYIFRLENNDAQYPILIAGGGGGLGLGQFMDNGNQHGQGRAPSDRQPASGKAFSTQAGPGGGWNGVSNNEPTAGMLLVKGGVGGNSCSPWKESHGNGGFGGGGGGCLTGGGGGGYIGGSTGHTEQSYGNGEGGYSYASHELIHVHFEPGVNHGPGEIHIIPAISGCGCNFRCASLDQHLSETECLCPPGWVLSDDSKSCILAEDSKGMHQTFVVLLIVVSIASVFGFIAVAILLYNCHQSRKALLRRRQIMFSNGTERNETELQSLPAVSDRIMTELNPNYEFAGDLYKFKDLPEIPRSSITLVDKRLGQGAFGEVFQGVYRYSMNLEIAVAVKTISASSGPTTQADFMMEALIMSKFNHQNIVRFIGVSFDKSQMYIVLELLAGGNLKDFLREERPRLGQPTSLTMLDLIMCGLDVANGCQYMEKARFIHRDIAARNCLLTSKQTGSRIVKIADFGMAKDIYRSDYYRKGGRAMLPIKWMPPESFLDGIFTTKTDVWAFGVLLWEIMSFGYMPYTGCTNTQTMAMVTSGVRLEKPAGCPDPIYGIMTQCWDPCPERRPSFVTIVERIGYCLQDPDVINHPTPNYEVLPIYDPEITIMRPDTETECINVQLELDACGYMQPKIVDPRSASQRMAQAIARNNPNPTSEGLMRANEKSIVQPADKLQPRYQPNPCSSRTGNPPKQAFENANCNECDEGNGHIETKTKANNSNCENESVHRNSTDIENSDKLRIAENGNNRPADIHSCRSSTIDTTDADRSNGNESIITTDTNSDSLIAASLDMPPETTNSSPNTRTCSPSHTGLNTTATNVNGMLKKNALKAALSLDPSTLCRGAIPYEKIVPLPQRSSMPGSIEMEKDPLSHELPREEECS